MKKYSLLVIPLLLWGCEKDFDNVIDTSTDNYQVSAITYVDHNPPVYDLKIPADSLLELRIIFTPESGLNKVYFDIYASDNSRLTSSSVEMPEINDNIFQNSFILKSEFPNGTYNVKFSVMGLGGNTKQAAVSSFIFNNGQDNIAPVISNTVVEPDTADVTDTTVIFTSVEAMDSNGVNDLEEVYFIVFRPDSTTNNSKVFLFDDGNTQENGDITAGDGIYSRLIQVDQNNDKGTYRFEFQAKDRSDSLSNIINHFVLIQ
jgi:hypothetical protein